MNKNYLYFIKKLNIKSWVKYWLLTAYHVKYILSVIYSGLVITINNTINKPIEFISILGNSFQDAEPTVESPVDIQSVGDTGELNLKIVNKNFMWYEKTTDSNNGITYTVNTDKSITMSGKATAQSNFYLHGTSSQYVDLGIPAGTYLYSGINRQESNSYVNYIVKKDKNNTTTTYTQVTNPVSITINEGDTFRVFLRVLTDYEFVTPVIAKIQLELATEITDYEEHKEKKYTIPVQYPLRKIKDVQDELDIINKKEIHKIGYIESYVDEEITTDYISTTGELSEGASVIYVLDEPIELDMTDNQLSIIYNMPRAFDIQTNIYSVDIPSPYFECQAYVKKEV